jgi:hypothetical protein
VQREVVPGEFDLSIKTMSNSGWRDERHRNEAAAWYGRYLDRR